MVVSLTCVHLTTHKRVAELLKPAEFAAIKGVSKPTVHEAMKVRIAAAVVTVDGRRMLNRELALELWDKNTRRNNNAAIGLPQDRRRAAKENPQPPAKPPTTQQLRAFIQGLPEDQIPDLNDSRARREHYLAEKARLDALQGRKELLPADQVKAEAFALARAVRDGMLGIADRLAPVLAATMDSRQVHQLLDEEIRVALRSLQDA